MTGQDTATTLVALSAGLTAFGYLARIGWRAVKAIERAVTDLVGANGQKSLRQEIVEVKTIAARSEKELHPNGGSSMRDDIRLAVNGVDDARTNAIEARADARRAADAVMDLKERGDQMTAQMLKLGEEGRRERAEIKEGQVRMRQDITDEMVTRTAEAFELIAAHGGPDIRLPLPVADHVHDVPIQVDPLTTSPPHSANP